MRNWVGYFVLCVALLSIASDKNSVGDQQKDLSESIDQLLEDIASGEKKMRVYKQMKMYNDESLNPVLYKKDDSKKG